jgi:hypothetical protein
MKRTEFFLSTLAVASAGAAMPAAAKADALTVSDAIARLFTAPAIAPEWFDAMFRAAIPIEQTRSIVAAIVAQLGAYRGIAPNGSAYTLTFDRGTLQAEGSLDANGAFRGLLFSRMQSAAAADRLTAVFTAASIPAEWFSARFLANVPIDRIRAIAAEIHKHYGALHGVHPQSDGTYDLAFEKFDAIATIYLGGTGLVEGLIIRPRGTPAEDD